MINYRTEIKDSWVQREPSSRQLAALLGLPAPVGLRAIVVALRAVETVFVERNVHTDDGAPLNGRVAFLLRSDGTYEFSGHMRATGLTSYEFAVQAWVNTGDGSVIAALRRGRVFGSDTPGRPRQRSWTEPGANLGIRAHWRTLRNQASLGYRVDAEIGGLLGGALDVLTFAIKGAVAYVALGPTGVVLLVGNELAGMDTQLGAPETLAGVIVAGGTLMIVGPLGLVPAMVAGAATASLLDVESRSMRPEERDFAERVFDGSLDYDRIRLTNMEHPFDGGRKFAFPTVGGNILVNLGKAAFANPVAHSEPAPAGTVSPYVEPGSLLIHELVHAWQLTHLSLVEVVCNLSEDYEYFDRGVGRVNDTTWQGRSWAGMNAEQQASIVDDWYGAHRTDLLSFAAFNDPAFRFIRDEIRTKIP